MKCTSLSIQHFYLVILRTNQGHIEADTIQIWDHSKEFYRSYCTKLGFPPKSIPRL